MLSPESHLKSVTLLIDSVFEGKFFLNEKYETTSVCSTLGNHNIHHTKLMNSTSHKYNIFSSAQRADPILFHWVAWLPLQSLFVNNIYFLFLLMYKCLCKCMHCVQVLTKARRGIAGPLELKSKGVNCEPPKEGAGD